MSRNVNPGELVQVVSGLEANVGKVVKILAPHPVARGYRNPDGSVVDCLMWQIEPAILGGDDQFYDCVADSDVRRFNAQFSGVVAAIKKRIGGGE